jgi:hypothetical protein
LGTDTHDTHEFVTIANAICFHKTNDRDFMRVMRVGANLNGALAY